MPRKIMDKSIKVESEIKRANRIVYGEVFLLLAVFPLFYHNYYFDILKTKYMFYYLTILIMTVLLIVFCGIPILIKHRKNQFISINKKNFKMITIPDICMILLILSIAVTTLQSDFKYESMWGNEARFNGLFLWMVYGLSYIAITRFLSFKSNLLDFFLFTGILVCLFGITDYFQMDILGFKEHIRESQKLDFTSTIGNINLYTAYVGMVVAVAMTLFVTARSRGKICFYYISLVVSFLGLIVGRSDNGYLALGILFVALPFWIFRTKLGIKRYLICVATMLSSVWLVSIVNHIWSNQVLQLDSLFGMMSESPLLIYGVIIIWLIVGCVYFIGRNQSTAEIGNFPRILWGIFIMICLIAGVYMLFDANVAGNGDKYGALSNYLVFSDSWGTDRGFVWKLAMKHFDEFSITRKIFGYGADTFGILARYNDFDTMVEYNNTFFESAHNEYIHYLVTIGLSGMTFYIALLCTSAYGIVKTNRDNPYAMAAVFAVLAYAAQATVNIAQPIVTPIMLTLLMVGLSFCRNGSEGNVS
ncbi:O-antigen ligase family protein [Hungatella hathewayi]|uniref:O-antigen ligase-related domain-containing protein n=2 Tax=Hungatella hathewayi TaxID=154046 RepID=G5IB04_9FIRM|nr:O-antigen ligase family protein [Hungatella hathewayi]EHI61319.1 hypothetical protein HMPREF9473_00681 [ [Hungatella hathewayi WAL-18680]